MRPYIRPSGVVYQLEYGSGSGRWAAGPYRSRLFRANAMARELVRLRGLGFGVRILTPRICPMPARKVVNHE